MSRSFVILFAFVSAGLGLGYATTEPSSDLAKPSRARMLLLPGEPAPVRLRLELTIDGREPVTAWSEFLDRLFRYFDRDSDGSLSRAEASRIFPLPLPAGKELIVAFAKLDADGDSKVSRAELQTFCRAHGFGPVVMVVEPPSTDDLRLAELFSRQLDTDRNGLLSRAELRQAATALRAFDLNEDDFLERSELLGHAARAARPATTAVQLGEDDACDLALRLDLGVKARPTTVAGRLAGSVRLFTAPESGQSMRLLGPGGAWALSFQAVRATPEVNAAGAFLIAQFDAARAERPALTRDEIASNPELAALRDCFLYADRNGDNALTLAEMEDYVRLIEAGLHSQLWVHVRAHDRNPFSFLDRDGDDRLSYRELTQAADLLLPDVAEVARLPVQVQLSFGGPAVRSWGGLPIPAVKARRPAAAPTAQAPRWFQAMDHNGDLAISPREFLGPPELFRQLDVNGDGVITLDEAVRAGERR